MGPDVPATRSAAPLSVAVGEHALQTLIDTIVDYAIFLIDPQGLVQTWNAGAQQLKGYAAEEIIGRHFSAFYTAEDVAAGTPQRILAQAARDGRVESEGWRVRKDGSRFWANVIITAVRDRSGKTVAFGKVTRDLTQRRRTEEQAIHLAEANAARATAEAAQDQLLRQLGQLPAGILVVRGEDHVIELANPQYQKLVGHRAVRGVPLVVALPELAAQPFLAQIDVVFRTGASFVGEETRAMLDRLGNGVLEECFFNVSYQPTFSATQQVNGVLVFSYEVTPEVRSRQRIEALVAKATLDASRKDEFLAMLAHELRNPLAALNTALYLLGRREARDEKEWRGREVCGRQVAILVRLVDDLLDVSRITRGRVELRRQRTDLTAIIQSAVQTTRPEFEQRHHQVSIAVDAGSFILDADPMRLGQVFKNILENAAKYTDTPGRIEVRLAREVDGRGAPWASVEISDPGRGLAPEMLERVFDLFTQVDRGLARTEGGLGIGLTIVRSLVEMHGGQIHARSDGLGRGTTIIIRLPLSPAVEASLPAGSPDPASGPKAHRRVVLVEDNEDVRETMHELLDEMGHEVAEASDGLRGRDLILATVPDLALVDLGLPGLDGYQVAREIRRHPDLSGTRLVALTGYGDRDSRQRALQAGFDGHLTKPFSLDQLEAYLAAPMAAKCEATTAALH